MSKQSDGKSGLVSLRIVIPGAPPEMTGDPWGLYSSGPLAREEVQREEKDYRAWVLKRLSHVGRLDGYLHQRGLTRDRQIELLDEVWWPPGQTRYQRIRRHLNQIEKVSAPSKRVRADVEWFQDCAACGGLHFAFQASHYLHCFDLFSSDQALVEGLCRMAPSPDSTPRFHKAANGLAVAMESYALAWRYAHDFFLAEAVMTRNTGQRSGGHKTAETRRENADHRYAKHASAYWSNREQGESHSELLKRAAERRGVSVKTISRAVTGAGNARDKR